MVTPPGTWNICLRHERKHPETVDSPYPFRTSFVPSTPRRSLECASAPDMGLCARRLAATAFVCLAIGAASCSHTAGVVVKDSEALAAALAAPEVLRISIKGEPSTGANISGVLGDHTVHQLGCDA